MEFGQDNSRAADGFAYVIAFLRDNNEVALRLPACVQWILSGLHQLVLCQL